MPWASAEQTYEQAEATARRLSSSFLSGADYSLGVWDGRRNSCWWNWISPTMWPRGMEVCGDRDVDPWHVGGRRLGTRVLAAMLDWGFGEWGWERLV